MTDRNKTRLALAAAVAAGLASASTSSAQLLYEPFNYTDTGATLDVTKADANKHFTTSGTWWARRGPGSLAPSHTIAATGLTGPTAAGVLLPANMGTAALAAANVSRHPVIGFGKTVHSGDVYYSLQMKVADLTATTVANVVAFTNFAIPTPSDVGIPQAALTLVPTSAAANTYRLTLRNNASQVPGPTAGRNGTAAGNDFDVNDTVFVVARYRIVPGDGNDELALWVNPTTGFGDNGAIPAPTITHTNVASQNDAVESSAGTTPTVAGLYMRSYSQTINSRFDEFRVDTTWAGVTPNGNLQYTWTDAGSAGPDTFANGDNWTEPVGAPGSAPNGVGHVVNFGAGANPGTVTSAGETIDQINFNTTNAVTIDGTGLTIGSNASAGQVYAYAGSHVINAPLTLSSDLSIKTQSGAEVQLDNTVSGTGKILGIYGNGTGTVTLGSSDRIDDDVNLEVRSGTLDLNGGSETVATLQLGTGAVNGGVNIANNNTIYNGDLASGNITNGTITSTADVNLQSGTISAVIAGSAGVTKTTSGMVTLSGNNSYTGTTTVSNGILTLAGAPTVPVTAQLNLIPATSGLLGYLAVDSNAALGASGASVTYQTNAGVVTALQFNNDMTLAADRTIVANAGSSRMAVADTKTATIDAVISGAGGVTTVAPWQSVIATSSGSTAAGTLVLNATNTYLGNTTVPVGTLGATSAAALGDAANDLVLSGGTFKAFGSFALGAARDVNVTANSTYDTNTFNTEINGVLGGAGQLTTTGSGELLLSNANTIAGRILISGNSAVRVTHNDALGAATTTPDGTTFIRGGAANPNAVLLLDGTAGDLTIAEPMIIEGKTSPNTAPHINNVGGNNTITTALNMDAAGTFYNLRSDAGKITIGGVNNATNATGRELHLRGPATGEINGPIQNTTGTGPFNVTKHDGGTWILSADNTYPGTTTINAGTLQIGNGGTAGTLGTLGVTNDGNLAFNRSDSVNVPNAISGTGSVTHDGTGTTTLQAVNTYTGGNTVNAGTLISTNGFRDGGPMAIANAAKAVVPATSPDTFNPPSTVPAGTNAAGSKVTSLSIAASGQLDLNNNDMLIDHDGSLDIADIRDLIGSGYNFGGQDGPGIISTTAANTDPFTFTLGYADNAFLPLPYGTVIGTGAPFAGYDVDDTAALIKFTWVGDVTLDGIFDFQDLSIFNGNYDAGATTGRVWTDGDLNYDGTIDFQDLSLFNGNYDPSKPSLPEPGGLAVLAAAAGLGMLRRRRRSVLN